MSLLRSDYSRVMDGPGETVLLRPLPKSVKWVMAPVSMFSKAAEPVVNT